MHIPDGYLSPIISVGSAVVTVPAWAIARQWVKSVLNYRTVILLGENRQIMADGPAQQVLENTQLLVKANLIHPELHYQGHFHNPSGESIKIG